MSQPITKSPTETMRCIETLITVFQRHAGKEGDKNKMSFKEFECFMKTELAPFVENQKDPDVLKKMMSGLDGSGPDGRRDGQLDFQEFLNLIGGLTCSCHNAMTSSGPARGRH
ncbi:protein S100-A11 [Microcaecilia unicolor]|uniref:Protein S100-A11 n=1 Tax=Microcaecilia unicolor TaxID=1415580 RepID=A0A6P7WZG7_9AMPH|nr:protein S100-A11 [Microcaecilia unicolor]